MVRNLDINLHSNHTIFNNSAKKSKTNCDSYEIAFSKLLAPVDRKRNIQGIVSTFGGMIVSLIEERIFTCNRECHVFFFLKKNRKLVGHPFVETLYSFR